MSNAPAFPTRRTGSADNYTRHPDNPAAALQVDQYIARLNHSTRGEVVGELREIVQPKETTDSYRFGTGELVDILTYLTGENPLPLNGSIRPSADELRNAICDEIDLEREGARALTARDLRCLLGTIQATEAETQVSRR